MGRLDLTSSCWNFLLEGLRNFCTDRSPFHSWDDWVPQDRLRKLTDDNRELAANLKRDLVQPQPTRTSTKPGSSSRRGKGQGSDLGSGRGSEERHSSVPAGGRGTKRGKDNDVEKVGSLLFIFFYSPVFPPHDPAQDS